MIPDRAVVHLVRAAFSWGCLVALVAAQDGSGSGAAPKKEEALPAPDYSQHMRSILSNHCFKCHGPDEKERKGGLRLDLYDAALKPAESVLVARIKSSDPELLMPPPKSNKQLTATEIEVLQRRNQ